MHSCEQAARQAGWNQQVNRNQKTKKKIQEHYTNMCLISRWALPGLGFVKGHGGLGPSGSGPVLQMDGEEFLPGN